jgi:hypothetical protein
MCRLLLLFLLSALSFAAAAEGIVRTCASESRPTGETPRELAEAWLRFHASDLCQNNETTFLFRADGMEVRVLVEDEGGYEKLQKMLEPLRGSYRIVLEATRPPEKEEERDSDKENDPPPSLWENSALRAYLGDPQSWTREQTDFEHIPQSDPLVGDTSFKYRLTAYAERILDWSRKVERHATDLPALARMALDASVARELRMQAITVCRAHSEDLGKNLEKLEKNLKYALPLSARDDRRSSRMGRSEKAKDPVEAAVALAAGAQTAARRIHDFIYPDQHTVNLEELRQSSLLESLRELRAIDADFQKAFGKAVRK